MSPADHGNQVTAQAVTGSGDHSRQSASLWLAICTGVVFVILFSLGCWQVYRWQWKLDLIQRVESRVHQAAVAAPDRAGWLAVSRDQSEYLHVNLQGQLQYALSLPVVASTIHGSGYWVMTPLIRNNGERILINRGFVKNMAAFDAELKKRDEQPVSITGLLRISEPGGSVLRKNDPDARRWYSRDVKAMGQAMGLTDLAPYFVDQEAGTEVSDGPVAGLTVIRFQNSHVVYALTWFTLAALSLVGYRLIRRHRRDDRD